MLNKPAAALECHCLSTAMYSELEPVKVSIAKSNATCPYF